MDGSVYISALSSLADAKGPINEMATNPETLKELQNFIDLTKNVLEE
jgi:hypothetical protein